MATRRKKTKTSRFTQRRTSATRLRNPARRSMPRHLAGRPAAALRCIRCTPGILIFPSRSVELRCLAPGSPLPSSNNRTDFTSLYPTPHPPVLRTILLTYSLCPRFARVLARPDKAKFVGQLTSSKRHGTVLCHSSFGRTLRPLFPGDRFQSWDARRLVRRSSACRLNRPVFPQPSPALPCFHR